MDNSAIENNIVAGMCVFFFFHYDGLHYCRKKNIISIVVWYFSIEFFSFTSNLCCFLLNFLFYSQNYIF